MTSLFRAEPDVPYDKVTASDTGANATSHRDLDYIKNIRDATNFQMKRIPGSPTLHIFATMKDGSKRRIGSLSHRVDDGNYRIDSNTLSNPVIKKNKSKPKRRRSTNTRKPNPIDSFGSVDHGHVVINPLQ